MGECKGISTDSRPADGAGRRTGREAQGAEYWVEDEVRERGVLLGDDGNVLSGKS